MPRHTLGDLQHAIMAVLWERGEASAAEVHEALRKARGLALTTIATMLRKMEDKGVVAHRASGRQFLYRPTVSEDQVRRSMVGELVERLFGGDPKALVAHLKQFPAALIDHTLRLRCPRHPDVVMLRRAFSRSVPVEVDECPQCGGLWLDADELAAIRRPIR